MSTSERYTRVSRVLFLAWCRTVPVTYTLTFCSHQNDLGLRVGHDLGPCLRYLSHDVIEPKPRVHRLELEDFRVDFFYVETCLRG